VLVATSMIAKCKPKELLTNLTSGFGFPSKNGSETESDMGSFSIIFNSWEASSYAKMNRKNVLSFKF
jgi:hypothetical protein